MSVFSQTGGILYHLRAFRYADQFWRVHRQSVLRFLEEWNPQSSTLVLVGCSGGYSLETSFLEKFENRIAYEPDWLARRIFENRHPVEMNWKGEYGPESELEPGAAVLFCNLLGQIQLLAYRKDWHERLGRLEWASYHDAFSGDRVDFYIEKNDRKKARAGEVRSWIHPRNVRALTVEVHEHEAFSLFQSKENRYFYWQWNLTPAHTHLIEGVFRQEPERES